MDYEYPTPIGRLAARFEIWRNPSWWNLLITLPFVFGIALGIYQCNSASTVAAREKTVAGRISSHESWNHNRYGYVFHVNGQEFSGWETPMGAEPNIGQEVLVYYDPNDPALNSLTDFQQKAWRDTGPVPFEVVAIAFVAFIIAMLRRNAAREQTPQKLK